MFLSFSMIISSKSELIHLIMGIIVLRNELPNSKENLNLLLSDKNSL